MADSQVLPTSLEEENRLLPSPTALEAKVLHSCVARPATAAASTAMSGQIKYNSVIIYEARKAKPLSRQRYDGTKDGLPVSEVVQITLSQDSAPEEKMLTLLSRCRHIAAIWPCFAPNTPVIFRTLRHEEQDMNIYRSIK